jgi:hypothetical protein
MLLRELGAVNAAFWWLCNMRKEPGSKALRRLKVAVMAGTPLMSMNLNTLQ